ncbi:MAG: signal peptidase II [Acidobacteria bacterium]|nr:signal peptidase II [Acidobacteriota bacterium]
MQPEMPAGPPRRVAAPDAAVQSAGSLLWWLIATIVLADQVSKVLVQHFIPLFDSVTIVPGVIDLVHIHNAGVAFGLMNDMDHPYRSALTLTLALAALAGIVYYSRQIHQGERLARTGLSLILGGAIGNLIDRVRLGHVVDFIDVYWGTWHFWAFNVADAAISCGAALIFIELFFAGRHASHSV